MQRNPLINPRPGDVLTRVITDKTFHVRVQKREKGLIFVTHEGKKGSSARNYTLARWCIEFSKWTIQTIAKHNGEARDPRSEPRSGDVLHRPDLAKNSRRKVLGTSSVTLPSSETHIEIQYHTGVDPKPHFDSCSIQSWRRWAAPANICPRPEVDKE